MGDPFPPKIFLEIFFRVFSCTLSQKHYPPFLTPKMVGRGGGIRRGEGSIGGTGGCREDITPYLVRGHYRTPSFLYGLIWGSSQIIDIYK